jgi:cytochrome c oxidase subunit 4
MSTSTVDPDPVGPGDTMPVDHVEAHGHQHPTDRQYVIIALILGVITAAEVGTYFIEDASTTFLVAVLFPMMIVKFFVVCAWFMHLRFDNPLFRRVFIFGLVLAIVVYCGIFLTAMEFWSSAYGRFGSVGGG